MTHTKYHASRVPSASPNASRHNMLPDNDWHAVHGWPLAELGCLAEVTDTPSLLMFANRARPLWRQAVYLALAVEAFNTPDPFLSRAGIDFDADAEPLDIVAGRLPTMKPADICKACFGNPLPGLLPVLKKLDSEPLRACTYRLLAQWYMDATRHQSRTSMLQQMVKLDQSKIDVVATLDEILLVPHVVTSTSNRAEASRLNLHIDVIGRLCSAATPEALRQSATALNGQVLVSEWSEGWLRRADSPRPLPFAADTECQPVTTASQLHDLARRFKNCLGSHYMKTFLAGRLCIVECFTDTPAVALVARLSDGFWVILSVHVPQNGVVSPELNDKVRQLIKSKSDRILEPSHVDPQIGTVLRQVYGRGEFFDFDEEVLT